MPFVPFQKKSAAGDHDADDRATSAPPAFSKKSSAKRRRKTGKAAPIQKSMMQSGRSFSGGSR